MGATHTENVPPTDKGDFPFLKIPYAAGTDVGSGTLMLGEADLAIQQMKVPDLRPKLTFPWNQSLPNLAFDIYRWLHLLAHHAMACLEGVPGVKVKVEGLCSLDLELLCGCSRPGTVI